MWLTSRKRPGEASGEKRGRSARIIWAIEQNKSEKCVTREMGFCAKEALRFGLRLDVALGLVLGGGWQWVLPRGC